MQGDELWSKLYYLNGYNRAMAFSLAQDSASGRIFMCGVRREGTVNDWIERDDLLVVNSTGLELHRLSKTTGAAKDGHYSKSGW